MEHSLGALLAQKSDEGHEQAIYYLSRIMVGAEHRYNPVEKECLALVFAVQKTRHYLTGQTIYVVSRVNPLRLLMTKPSALNGRLTKWAMFLSQYDIHFLPQKSTKGQVIADLLAEHPRSESVILFEELPDETAEVHSTQVNLPVWQMYFDGASRTIPRGGLVAGVGIVLISTRDHVILHAFSLIEPCTNNVAEYNALLIGLQLAHQLGVRNLQGYGDSELVVNQLRGEYEVRSDDLIPYFNSALQMAEQFEGFYIGHVPRRDNTHADALAGLATSLCLQAGEHQNILVCARSLFHPKWTSPKDPLNPDTIIPLLKSSNIAASSVTLDWRIPFIDYIMYNIRADDQKLAASVRKKAVRLHYNPESQTLYYVTRDGIMLRCLSPSEA